MKLGLGLYPQDAYSEKLPLRPAVWLYALIIHMVDYFNPGATDPQTHAAGLEGIWGFAGDPHKLWTYRNW